MGRAGEAKRRRIEGLFLYLEISRTGPYSDTSARLSPASAGRGGPLDVLLNSPNGVVFRVTYMEYIKRFLFSPNLIWIFLHRSFSWIMHHTYFTL